MATPRRPTVAGVALCWAVLQGLLLLAAAHNSLPVNPALGEPGFPDCWQPGPLRPAVNLGAVHSTDRVVRGWQSQLEAGGPWLDARTTLRCGARPKYFAAQLSVGCIGDSITAGSNLPANNSLFVNKNNSYPAQLQALLGDGYSVTNLGACGSDMIRNVTNRTASPAFSPYWERAQFQALIKGKWDILVIMLGTNDANVNDEPPCWELGCPFARSFKEMIELVQTLGTTPAGPEQGC
jgi:hypothetical protein